MHSILVDAFPFPHLGQRKVLISLIPDVLKFNPAPVYEWTT